MRLTLPLAALAIAILLGCEKSSTPSSTSSQAKGLPPPEVTVSFPQLLLDYSTNEVAADNKYKGKVLLVTGGGVERVGKDVSDKAFVVCFSGGSRTGQFFFEDSAPLASLKPGQQVNIKGRCTGLMMNVILEDCELVPVEPRK